MQHAGGGRGGGSAPRNRVGAVLVTYRRTDPLLRSFDAVVEQSHPPVALVVVDNGPTPIAATMLENRPRVETDVLVLHRPDNPGPAGGLNVGLAELRKSYDSLDWILFLDDDNPLPRSDVVEAILFAVTSASPGSEAIGGAALRGGRFVRPLLLCVPVPCGEDGNLVGVDYLFGGSCALYRTEALTSVGGFRDSLFWGFEELDLGLRLTAAGWRLVAVPYLATVGTGIAPTSKGIAREISWRLEPPNARQYYGLRNLIDIGRTSVGWHAVIATATVRGFGKPILNSVRNPALALSVLRANARSISDGVRGRLGRREGLLP